MRIGILGGTFDPIHYGHIRSAMEVKTRLGLDKILLMPNHIPPHKHITHSTTTQRLEMVTQVCNELAGFELCDIEAKRDTPSYTVVTLKQLSQLYPNDELFFIMGTDSFIHLQSWHKWQQLFKYANFVVCQRPGWHLSHDNPMQHELFIRKATIDSLTNSNAPKHGRIFTMDINPQDISSSQIRSQLALGKIPQDVLMPITLNYILKQRLYLS